MTRARCTGGSGPRCSCSSRDFHVDVTSARTEYYARPGALPTVERSSLRQDLFRRDFTINAMAACIDPDCFGAIADPFGGLRDLERGVVRVLHALSFVDDPTRVLRAARFEERYGFRDGRRRPRSWRGARSSWACSTEVSGARIREELLDILDEEPAGRALERLDDLGALAALLPDGRGRRRVRRRGSRGRGRRCASSARGSPRAPERRVALLAALLGGLGPGRRPSGGCGTIRLGREYAEAVARARRARRRACSRALQDRRGMRDSRLLPAARRRCLPRRS